MCVAKLAAGAASALAVAGAPAASAAPAWEDPAVLSSTTDGRVAYYRADVAAAGGHALVASVRDTDEHCSPNPAPCLRVHVSTRASGEPFRPPEPMLAGGNPVTNPVAAVNPSGEAFLAWGANAAETPCCRRELIVVGRPAGSRRFGGGRVSRVGANVAEYSLAANDAGHVVVAWIEQDPRTANGTLLMSARAPGEPFGAPVVMAESAIAVAAAVSDDGRILLAWSARAEEAKESRLYARVGFAEPQLVTSLSDSFGYASLGRPEAVWTRTGDRIVSWASNGGGCDLKCFTEGIYVASARGRGSFGQPHALSHHGGDEEFLPLPGGETLLAWSEAGELSGRRAIQVASRPSGGDFGDPLSHGLRRRSARFVQLALAGGGTPYAMWIEQPHDSYTSRLKGMFGPQPGASPIVRPVPHGVDAQSVDVASLGSGELVAAWSSHDNSDGQPNTLKVAFGPDDSDPPRISLLRRAGGAGRLRFRFRLSEPADVEVSLRRVGSGSPQVSLSSRRRAGTNRVEVRRRALRRLRAGRYRATLRATDRAGNVSAKRTVAFRVRAAG